MLHVVRGMVDWKTSGEMPACTSIVVLRMVDEGLAVGNVTLQNFTTTFPAPTRYKVHSIQITLDDSTEESCGLQQKKCEVPADFSCQFGYAPLVHCVLQHGFFYEVSCYSF